MSLSFPRNLGIRGRDGGADHWPARVPQDPLLRNEIKFIQSKRADEGVGCGPGTARQSQPIEQVPEY
jgi:hypothetical protein